MRALIVGRIKRRRPIGFVDGKAGSTMHRHMYMYM